MTLRICFIGTGRFADKHQHIVSRMEGVAVTGFCGRTMESAERLAGKWPGARGFASAEDMLDACKPDAVYISVTPGAHGAYETLLVERGIPFFTEKPLGIDPEELREARDQVAAKRLITSVGYNWRYLESTARARERLRETTVGMALGYFMGTMPGIQWWRRMSESGGQFNEQTTHVVDLLRYVCGEVTELYAAFGTVAPGAHEGSDVPDVGTVTMKLAGGAVATVSNTCMLPRGHHTGLDVYTRSGVIELRSAGYKEIGADMTVEYRNTADPYERENAAFLHAVRTGDTSGILSDYADAFRSFEVCAAASLSAREGRAVRLV